MRLFVQGRYSLSFIIAILIALLSSHCVRAQTGWQWGIRSTHNSFPGVTSYPLAIDTNRGYLYEAGIQEGDSTTLGAYTVYNPSASEQLVLVKADTLGHFLWATGSQSANVAPISLAVDATGNVYMFGQYVGVLCVLGIDSLINPLGKQMYFLSKVSPTGTVLWAKNVLIDTSLVPGVSPFQLGGMVIDDTANIYVTGMCDFHPSFIGGVILDSLSLQNIFVAKFDSAGNPVWGKTIGAGIYSNTLSIDAGGNLYVSGQGRILATDSSIITSSSPYPTYLSKIKNDGSIVWAQFIGSVFWLCGSVCDNSKNVYLVGYGNGAIGGIAVPFGVAIIKYDSSGSLLWVKSGGGISASDIAYDTRTNTTWVTGSLFDSVSFDGHSIDSPAGNFYPMFIAHFDSLGNYLTGMALPAGGCATGGAGSKINSIVLDGKCDYYIGGHYYVSTMVIGMDTLSPDSGYTASLFLAKYNYDSLCSHPIPLKDDYPQTLQSNVNIYPNPVQNELTVSSSGAITSVSVITLLGQTVLTRFCNFSEEQIDVTYLPPGIYLVRVNGTEVRKFIKE